MTNYDILTRLKNGESCENIADEFVNALNEAKQAYDKEQAKAVAEEKAKEAKIKDTQKLLDMFQDYQEKYYPDYAGTTPIDPEDFIEALDDLAKGFDDLKSIFDTFTLPTKEDDKPNPSVETKRSVDKIIEDFIKGF